VNQEPATPRDAAAVILLNQDGSQVLWAQRNPKIPFLGGFHAFPGGKTDAADALVAVQNCVEKDLEKFIVSAARELFEEVGVLLARGGEKLTKGQRASLHDDLISGRNNFAEILDDWGLSLDARDFFYTGHWTTPAFSPVRFKTRFFIAVCPPKQTPYAAITEMQNIEFVAPCEALKRWANSEVLISPPVLISLQELADSKFRIKSSKNDSPVPDLEAVISSLREKSLVCDGNIDYIELNPRIICFPLRTETLPPATHTNCFIVGGQEFVVIDAASKDEGELEKLFELTDSFIEQGFICKEIIVSHLHRDHTGGESILQTRMREKFGLEVPISAHRITAESLGGKVAFQKFIEPDEIIKLRDRSGAEFEIRALHTPGHARGHLCFYDESRGFLLSSDNVVGAGTVVIAPPEGDMTDYLNSLERMKNLPGLRHLCGSHGAAVYDARGNIEEYITHRQSREKHILEALKNGARTAEEITEIVYQGLKPELFPLAVKSVEAHLAKIRRDQSAAGSASS
jgi:glyoxylase-like metal-dependent hydrolase (beta-lactamase superfamily II)/8-oxo-dGTP pyrophosphatase MutT (NUDIX family)